MKSKKHTNEILKDLHAKLIKVDQGSKEHTEKEYNLLNYSQNDNLGNQLLACCFIEIMRINAPRVIYNSSQLKKIFKLFLKQIQQLKTVDEYFEKNFYLLESIVALKSIVLIKDLKFNSILNDIYQILGSVKEAVFVNLRDLLVQTIDEVNLPLESVEIVFSSFSKKVKKFNPQQHRMSIEFTSIVQDKFQKYLCIYFSERICGLANDLQEKWTEFKEIHTMLIDIHKTVPGLLLTVVPQLVEELGVEDPAVRQIACLTLGDMFNSGNFITLYRQVFEEWLERRKDSNVDVRISWLEFACRLISNPEADVVIGTFG